MAKKIDKSTESPDDKTLEEKVPGFFVITCGDEGVQVNVGARVSLVGAGVELEGAAKVIKALQKLLGKDLRIAASGESDWVKQQLNLDDYEQADATAQQRTQLLADELGLMYSGFLPFTDPRQLKHDIKGHMVRPHKVHVANKVCFTLAGGEQTYNLGHYQISAEWLHLVDKKIGKKVIKDQVDFYTKISGLPKLEIVIEEDGILGDKIAAKNKKILEGFGYKAKA